MVGSSAAARRRVLRIAWLAAAVVVVAIVPRSAQTASHTTPLVQVTPNELRLTKPVLNLAADDGRAAFVTCQQLVGVWRPGTTRIVKLGRLSLWTCPPPTSAQAIQSLAIANDRIAWGTDDGGNIVDNWVFVTTLAHPHTLTGVANISHCCRGQADQERMGYVYGDGNFLAFGTRVKCGDRGGLPCTTPSSGFANYSAWRIRRPPFTSANCVYTRGPCKRLANSPTRLEPMSVGARRIALRREDGTVVVRDWDADVVRTFPALADLTHGAELMGNKLVVLVPAHVVELSLRTGAQLAARVLPQLPNAGVCGILPCLPTSLRMMDAARGLVAYTLAGKLHLLRLRDGRDRVVGTAVDARFGDSGLFFTYTAPGPYPWRIRFVRWSALPVRP